PGRVGDDRDCPEHQLGLERRVRRPGRVRAGGLREDSMDALVEAVDGFEHLVGLGPRAEEDRLERLRGVDETLEGRVERPGVEAGADEVERGDRADPERSLAVHEPDRPLLVDAAQDGAVAWEVAVVCHRPRAIATALSPVATNSVLRSSINRSRVTSRLPSSHLIRSSAMPPTSTEAVRSTIAS